MKGWSSITNLISFYDKMIHLVAAGRSVDVWVLGNCLTLFPAVFWRIWLLMAWGEVHSLLVEELAGQAQRGLVNGVQSSWQPVLAVFPGAQSWFNRNCEERLRELGLFSL